MRAGYISNCEKVTLGGLVKFYRVGVAGANWTRARRSCPKVRIAPLWLSKDQQYNTLKVQIRMSKKSIKLETASRIWICWLWKIFDFLSYIKETSVAKVDYIHCLNPLPRLKRLIILHGWAFFFPYFIIYLYFFFSSAISSRTLPPPCATCVQTKWGGDWIDGWKTRTVFVWP